VDDLATDSTQFEFYLFENVVVVFEMSRNPLEGRYIANYLKINTLSLNT